MSTQRATREDRPAGLNPPPRAAAPWRLVAVEPLDGFRLRVRFVDGLEGVVDMGRLVRSETAGVFAALASPALFARARIEYGAVVWPGGIDLAPDAMHREILARDVWMV